MSSVTNNTDFSFEYAVSIIITLVVCSMTVKRSPQMNSFVIILLGLVVAYISLLLINKGLKFFKGPYLLYKHSDRFF